jgi:hypothetical protein
MLDSRDGFISNASAVKMEVENFSDDELPAPSAEDGDAVLQASTDAPFMGR